MKAETVEAYLKSYIDQAHLSVGLIVSGAVFRLKGVRKVAVLNLNGLVQIDCDRVLATEFSTQDSKCELAVDPATVSGFIRY